MTETKKKTSTKSRRRRPFKKKTRKRSFPQAGVSAFGTDTPQLLEGTLKSGTYIIFDIETTGGNPQNNGITEICAYKVKNNKVLDKFYSMVNPKVPIPPIVRKMTGITNKMVADAPLIEDVMPQFVEFVGNHILVSHNTIGDLKFIHFFAKKTTDVDMKNFFLCTHLLTEKLIEEAPNKSLTGLAEFFSFPIDETHRAEADTELTMRLFHELMKRMADKGFKTIKQGIRLQGDYDSGFKIGWGVAEESIEKLPGKIGVFFLKNFGGEIQFVSSSFDIRRDVRKITVLEKLPKPLLRIVLQTYSVEYKLFPNIFEAMLFEVKEELALKVKYVSSGWHRRLVTTLNLAETAEGKVELAVGSAEEITKKAFGHIKDRKQLQNTVKNLSHAFGNKLVKKTGEVEREALHLIDAYLLGNLHVVENQILKSFFSLKMLFSSSYRKKYADDKRYLQLLREIELPFTMENFLESWGFFVVRNFGKGARFSVYPISATLPLDPIDSDSDELPELVENLEIQKAAAMLLDKKNGSVKLENVCKEKALERNVLIWHLYGRGNKPDKRWKFVSLKEYNSYK